MTRARLLIVALISPVLLVGLVGPAMANDDFRFEGKGWGHGIGMTQYGALEQAKDGRNAKEIIEHYYRSATVGQIPDAVDKILVGMRQSVYSTAFIPRAGNATIRFGGDGPTTAHRGRRYRFVVQSSDWKCHLKVQRSDGSWKELAVANTCHGSINWSGSTRIQTIGKSYQVSRGRILVRPHPDAGNDRFHFVAEIPTLDEYLYGLAEVPYSWHSMALRAQAIAGRSYAAFRILDVGGSASSPPRDACWCHVYDSTQDQVYAGWDREQAPAWKDWRLAVDRTTRRGVKAPGQSGTIQGVVQAFYSSSSGGRTENIEDVWRKSDPRPYFSSVDDPWSLRQSNRYRRWALSSSEGTLRRQLRNDGIVFDDLHTIRVVQRNESGSARTVRVTGLRNGSSKTANLTGDRARSVFGLRSAYINRVFLPPFVDDDGLVHEESIIWLADEGITHGCNPPTNDRFCPGESVTRAQMAGFLVRAFELTEKSSAGNFEDVPKDHTFAEAINKLATEGITHGCNPPDNTRFCPDERVTRAQMAAFLVRAFELSKESDRSFSDVPKDHTFAEAINRLATEGITHGCNPPDNTRFCPGDAVTRAQMATFLSRGPW